MVKTLLSMMEFSPLVSVQLPGTLKASQPSRYRGRAFYQLNGYRVLEMKDLPEILPDQTDRLITVDNTQPRPDITSRKYLLSSFAGWAIMRASGIFDPYTQYVIGMTVRVPTTSRLFSSIAPT
jgi:hypothetical protein